jgi:hypothetical protein
VEQCLFADAEAGKKPVQHIFRTGLSGQRVDGAPGKAQILGDDQKIGGRAGRLKMVVQLSNSLSLSGM